MTMKEKIRDVLAALESRLSVKPDIALVLGSGLGGLADELEDAIRIPYTELPHFPAATVPGHAGRFVVGRLHSVPVIAMQGRYHYYEGYTLEQVTLPVRVMQALGAETVILTNAAGGVNETFQAGDLMVIRDHINWFHTNPLIGKNEDELGPRFPDMSEVYDRSLRALAKETAQALGISLKEGVYFGLSGPSYETPAEVRMIRKLGGDAVGMSTVPEAIAARHGGMKVLGFSCITNAWSGTGDQPLSHEEVIETSERVKAHFTSLIKAIVKRMGE